MTNWYFENNMHPYTTMVSPFDNEKIAIDQKIAPIISLMWDNGIETLTSCQGDTENENPDLAHFVFTSFALYASMLNLLQVNFDSVPDYGPQLLVRFSMERETEEQKAALGAFYQKNADMTDHTHVRNYEKETSRIFNGELLLPGPRVFFYVEHAHLLDILDRVDKVRANQKLTLGNYAPVS